MKNEQIKQLVSTCYELLQELGKQSFDKDCLKLEIIKLNNQKDIALQFIGKPKTKKDYKKIIEINKQYQNYLIKLIEL